jgi:hypothetical protein
MCLCSNGSVDENDWKDKSQWMGVSEFWKIRLQKTYRYFLHLVFYNLQFT